MNKIYLRGFRFYVLVFSFIGLLSSGLHAQINFAQSELDFNGNGSVANGVTGMMYGPDGRLYVTEYPGLIKILTVQRNSATDYEVTAVETLNGIQTMADHNDDGSPFSITERETIGIVVGGTAANPVFYVSSSDFRIGSGVGGGNGDVGLDTNSGVITRFTWTGSSWDVVDIIRGLPRSEENHATNGLELVTINGTNYLLIAQGGHTNGGSPSENFVYTCEYALSAAVLSVNLDQINALQIQSDNGRQYVYDLPTLDDPSRPNVNGITDPDVAGYDGIDVNDPWGGNDGLNQAIIDPLGPVQIFSPGYRNAYDLVVTQSGALYVTDNGANQGWGGFPVNEGGANANNDYDSAEPGSSSASGGEQINNLDHLQLVTTNLQTYVPGSYYGGHPNPTRANPNGAGLYVAPNQNGNTGAVFRTQTYDPNGSTTGSTTNANIALPANWPPVQSSNPVEGDWRGPGIANPDGPVDGEIVVWNTNTNGITEYTASNFGGAMQGDLLAGHSGGNIHRVELNANGTAQNLSQNFLSGIGGNALAIHANADTDVFPGTIWAGTLNGKIVVFEPQDFVNCINPGEPGYDANADYDSDGYTNQDEEDNGTDPCNGGSQPSDFDKSAGAPLVSDLNDNDDDADGIPDATDPFQLGNPATTGSDAFTIPIVNDLFNDQQGLGGIFGLGMTGLMNNGDTGANWLDWLDRKDDPNDPNPNDVLGGAPGLMTSHMTSGTALGATNTQEKGYQFGVQSNTGTGKFTVIGNLIQLDGGPFRLYDNTSATGGELGHFIGDGTQSNYIKIVLNTGGITALQEINDVPQTPINVNILPANRPTTGIVFYFVVDPSNGQVQMEYAIDGGTRISIGTVTAQGSILNAIQQTNQDLAVGFIGTSNTPGVELEGTWDFLSVIGEAPVVTQSIPDITRTTSAPNESLDLNQYFLDDNGVGNLTYSVFNNSNPAVGASISSNTLNLTFPGAPAVSNITIRATDADSNFVDETFAVTVTDAPIVLYRVNTGGPQITAIDGGLDWEADQPPSNNSQYLATAGSNQSFASGNLAVDGAVDQSTTPLSIYATERYDANAGAPNMTYSFPVAQNGNYEVRLYMGNSFVGTSQPGSRIFDTEIEGVVLPLLNDIDLSGTYGHEVGTVISHILNISDGSIDISFPHVGPENPIINAIEIIDAPNDQTPIYVNPIANQFNSPGDVLNGSLGVNAFGGDGNLQYSASGFPTGVTIEPTNGQIGGTVDAGATPGPYNVTITVNDSDGSNTDIESINFVWNIGSNDWVLKNENQSYTARHECSFVQAGDKFYLMGGRENAQTLDVYDYATDTWVNLTASAPKEFNHFQATEYQGLIWVIGAFGDNGFPNEVPEEFIWAFDPSTNEWIQGPQIPAARRRGSAGLVVLNNKFYVVGGNTDGHDGGYIPWFDEYDPATGIWTPLADAPRARDHFSAAVIGNNLYLAGGRLSGGAGGVFAPTIPEVDVYNFGSGTWSTLPNAQNIPTPRGGASSVNFNDKLVVIGGEVQNQDVYGVNTTDALKITEEYDPVTQAWTRKSDLNNERHGTQAIVSGAGIFITAGSDALGGGNQTNMEYLGLDNPQGSPSLPSTLAVPTSVLISDGATEDIAIDVTNGNVGILVTSMEITGANAADFSITAGELTNQLLNANASHTVSVNLAGTGPNRNAVLTVNYNNGESIDIDLTNFDSNLNVTNPGTQNNNEGDTVTLQIQANGASTYSASGLPPTLEIDPNTGLISGTITAGGVNSGPFLEQAGLVVMEAESGVVVPDWTETTIGGATGIIAGTNHLSIQDGGTIPYQITIGAPGVYRFNWRSFYSGTEATEENDNWLRFPNNDDVWFFGFKGTPADEASLIANVTSVTPTNIVFPKGSSRVTAATTPEGNGSNGYFKIYRSGGTSEVYDWQARTSDNDAHDIYVYFVNAGTYTMEISERSAGHAIDKMALYKLDDTNLTNAQLTAAPESTRAGGGGAAENSPYTVTVSVSDGGSNASTQFIWNVGEEGDPIAIASADPTSGFAPLDVDFTGSSSTDDVGITGFLWDFGDGSPTDTNADPSHTFTAVGTYTVQLTVTDGDGNSSSTDLTITVTDPSSAGTIRINAGGPTYTFNGSDWNEDQHFIGGAPFENVVAIANTPNDQLYQTERFNNTGTLTYEIPVVSGSYNVNLHFAELFFGLPGLGENGGVGSRVFDINVENGQFELNDYDIFEAAGGAGTAVIETLTDIEVTDGNLTITLVGTVENPKISGIEVILPGGDTAPVAYAGEDQNIVLTSTNLDGSATDADGGGIVSYNWTQVSGPSNASFSSANADDTVISNLVQGVYTFQLIVTDEEGDTGSDTVTITVGGQPGSLLINSGGPTFTFGTEEWTEDEFFQGGTPFESVVPIANTTNDQLYQTERFDTSGTLVYEIPVSMAADYNVDLHFAELFFGQPGLGVNGGVGDRVFNIDIEGQVQVDNYDIFEQAGGSATAIIESYKAITVNDGSLTITLTGVVENPKISGIAVYDTTAPIADAGADVNVNLPTNTVTLNGSGSDPDGGAIVTYQWTQESGPNTATLSNDTTPDVTADDLVAGDYVFRLTVTDDEDVTGFDDVTVTVIPENGNQAPTAVAEATPLNGTAPLEVTFTGSSSTDDVAVVSYQWDFGDGSDTADVADPTHIYQTAGVYTATLTVADADGLTNAASVEITVSASGENQAPTAIAGADVTLGVAPLTVNFDGSNSIDDVGIESYVWSFDDNGSISDEINPTYTFTSPGTYEVSLTVTDGEDLTGIATIEVIVTDANGNIPPRARAEADPVEGEARLLVNFVGENSTAAEGATITDYAWDFGDDSPISNAMNPEHIYDLPGEYTATLTVTDSQGLTDSDTITILVNPNGDEVSIRFEVNPVNANQEDGVARIVIVTIPEDVDVSFVTIHDVGGRYISGHSLLSDTMEIVGGMYELPISSLETGLYLVRVSFSNGDSSILKLLVDNN